MKETNKTLDKYYKVISVSHAHDLPKKEDCYFVLLKGNYDVNIDVYRYRNNNLSQKVWLDNVKAYLMPIKTIELKKELK